MSDDLVFEKFIQLSDITVMRAVDRIFARKIREKFEVRDLVRGRDGQWIVHLSKKLMP